MLHAVQAGRADVQDTAYVSTVVSQLAHEVHAVALGHCGHRLFRFSMCRSDELISANDPSAAQRLQLGTLYILLSSTVTLSLYLSLG